MFFIVVLFLKLLVSLIQLQLVAYTVCFYYDSQPDGDNLIINETKIAKNGFCHHCRSVLEHHQRITDDEFVELQQAFMNESFIRNGDIFMQSSPEELSQFRHFLEQHQSHPFTVVFDGLNIACVTGDPKLRSQLVREFCH